MDKDEVLKLALDDLIAEYHMETSSFAKRVDEIFKQALAAQPAVQEPVAFFDWYDNAHWGNEDFKEGCHRSWNAAIKYTTPPAAQPAVPDAITDDSESPEYRTGWNDCRAEMLKGMK
jgi:hypothetical protein